MNYFNSCNKRCRYVPLTIFKVDEVLSTGISGAVFELTACDGSTCRGTTDSNGLLTFCILICNTYILKEITPPTGYAPIDHIFNIRVDSIGCVFVDDVPTSHIIVKNIRMATSATFTAIKVNIVNGLPLAGATYTLFMNSLEIASTVSNAAGQVTFTNLSSGTYELVETISPTGFQTNTERLTVVVNQNGTVTIMDQPANGFILNDVPLNDFIFRKIDASTGLPLAGATYVLNQNGTIINTVTSGANGVINFGTLSTGLYQLTETITPTGFQPNTTVYQVVVGANGSITVNGIPLDEFVVEDMPITIAVSAPPTINTIYEEASVINGTGVPGSTVVVTFPNGATVSTTVNSSGTWTANVPSGIELVVGQIVSAVQTESGKLPSIQVTRTVIALVEPLLEKAVENLTNPSGVTIPGNVLEYTIRVGNLGDVGSVWDNVVLTDFIDDDISFLSGTVTIDGQLIPVGNEVGQYIYDSATRTLTIYIGDLASGEIRTVTFHVMINLDAAGAEIINSVIAMSISGVEPIVTALSPAIIVEE